MRMSFVEGFLHVILPMHLYFDLEVTSFLSTLLQLSKAETYHLMWQMNYGIKKEEVRM